MKLLRITLSLALSLAYSLAFATTLSPEEATDPKQKQTVTVKESEEEHHEHFFVDHHGFHRISYLDADTHKNSHPSPKDHLSEDLSRQKVTKNPF